MAAAPVAHVSGVEQWDVMPVPWQVYRRRLGEAWAGLPLAGTFDEQGPSGYLIPGRRGPIESMLLSYYSILQ
jgi:hypothetical protein